MRANREPTQVKVMSKEEIYAQHFHIYTLAAEATCESIFAPYYIHEGEMKLDNWMKAVDQLEAMVTSSVDPNKLSQRVSSINDNEYKSINDHWTRRNKIFAEVSQSKYSPLLNITYKHLWPDFLDKVNHQENLNLLTALSETLSTRRKTQLNLTPLVVEHYDYLQKYIQARSGQIVNFSANPINLVKALERQLTAFPKYQKKFLDAQETIKKRLSPSLTSISSPSLSAQSSPSSSRSQSEEKPPERRTEEYYGNGYHNHGRGHPRRYEYDDDDIPDSRRTRRRSFDMFPDLEKRRLQIEANNDLPDEYFHMPKPSAPVKKVEEKKQTATPRLFQSSIVKGGEKKQDMPVELTQPSVVKGKEKKLEPPETPSCCLVM